MLWNTRRLNHLDEDNWSASSATKCSWQSCLPRISQQKDFHGEYLGNFCCCIRLRVQCHVKARPRQVWAYVNRKQNSKLRQILRQSPWTQTRCLWITYRSSVFLEAAAYKLSWIWVWWLLCVDHCTHACEYRTNAGIRKILADSGSSVSDIWLAWTAK